MSHPHFSRIALTRFREKREVVVFPDAVVMHAQGEYTEADCLQDIEGREGRVGF
jgi:hypothetical protein